MGKLENELNELNELNEEQELDDDDLLDILKRKSTVHEQETEITRIGKAFEHHWYDILDLQPGVTEKDIKRAYYRKSLLVHPDKISDELNLVELTPLHPGKTKYEIVEGVFNRLNNAHRSLLDEKKREDLDEAIADARMLLIRDRKLTTDSEEVKDPDQEFMKAWKIRVMFVLKENHDRRKRQMEIQLREEGKAQKREEEEAAQRKRKREHEQDWEKTRDQRIGSWRDFQKTQKAEPKQKKKKLKTIG